MVVSAALHDFNGTVAVALAVLSLGFTGDGEGCEIFVLFNPRFEYVEPYDRGGLEIP